MIKNRTIGVYCITCAATGQKYVGRSVNVEQRLKAHRSQLKSNSHPSQLMQEHWNSFGANCFTFEILETFEKISSTELNKKEGFWIKKLGATYNNDACQEAYWTPERRKAVADRMRAFWTGRQKHSA